MTFLLAEVHTFLIMFGYGLLLGLIFTIYQRLLKWINPGKLWINLTDLVLGLLAGIAGFILLVFSNWGELRFYVFLSILLGFTLFFYLTRRLG